jgi:hypothetical protein
MEAAKLDFLLQKMRKGLKRDMKQRNVTGFAGNGLEAEYELRIKTLLNSKAGIINNFLRPLYYINRVFFPWHKHFEIGFEITNNN